MIKAGTAWTRCAEKGHISEVQKGFKLKTSKQKKKKKEALGMMSDRSKSKRSCAMN